MYTFMNVFQLLVRTRMVQKLYAMEAAPGGQENQEAPSNKPPQNVTEAIRGQEGRTKDRNTVLKQLDSNKAQEVQEQAVVLKETQNLAHERTDKTTGYILEDLRATTYVGQVAQMPLRKEYLLMEEAISKAAGAFYAKNKDKPEYDFGQH